VIAYLNGEITLKTPAYIYVDCHGVGYHVNISLNTYSRLEDLDRIKIYTYLNVKEDEQSLYGFFDEEERALFVHLISVSGIGVNTARVILSYLTPDEVRSAILNEQEVTFAKVKGIGPKTAKRIILDLKDKIVKSYGAGQQKPVLSAKTGLREEAFAALVALGFPRNTVDKHISSVLEKNPDTDQVEAVIKAVLKLMS
jgi:Holliday junction DNA helicase RuvA